MYQSEAEVPSVELGPEHEGNARSRNSWISAPIIPPIVATELGAGGSACHRQRLVAEFLSGPMGSLVRGRVFLGPRKWQRRELSTWAAG